MVEVTSNDNDAAREEQARPDANGQAAMLLVESLMHGLVARSVISVADAVEIVDVASDVKDEIAAETGEPDATMEGSASILGAVRASLALDLPR